MYAANKLLDSVEEVGRLLEEGAKALFNPATAQNCAQNCGGSSSIMKSNGNSNNNNTGNIVPVSIYQKLLNAATEGNEEQVKEALELGANLDVRDDNGMSAIHLAAWNGHAKTVLLLLEKGASPQATSKHGSTPVHAACDKGHTEIARVLLSNGGLVNAQNIGGMTALHHAAWNDFSVTATMLLGMGADMGIKDHLGRTPLHLASQQGSVTVACMLLDNGANPSPRDLEGHTPLYVAADSQTAVCLRKKMSLPQFKKMTPDGSGSTTFTDDASTTGVHQKQGATKTIIDSLMIQSRKQKDELAAQHEKFQAVETLIGLVKKLEKRDSSQKAEIAAQERATRALAQEHKAERATMQATIDRHIKSFNQHKTAVVDPLQTQINLHLSHDRDRLAQIEELNALVTTYQERDDELTKKLAVFGHLVGES